MSCNRKVEVGSTRSGRLRLAIRCPKSAQKLTLLSLGDSGKLVCSRGGVGGTPVQLLLSCRFSYWHRHCLFSERIWMATGHTDRGSRCERQHFRTGAIASRIARFDCWVTFLMALTRFEARREAVLNDANAIGRTALRARLLPEPHRTESLKLLREYAQIRIDYIPTGKSFAELPTLIERSNNIQEALWQQVKALSAKDNTMVPTGLFIQALNEMIDNQGKRLSALRNYIPDLVLLSLFGIAAVACGFAGYASGLDPLRTRLPVFITASLVCSVIFLILDLDRPNVGFITITHLLQLRRPDRSKTRIKPGFEERVVQKCSATSASDCC